jgi:hypothetical protein
MRDNRIQDEAPPDARPANVRRTDIDDLAAYLSIPSSYLLDAVDPAATGNAAADAQAQPVFTPIMHILHMAESALGDRASVWEWLDRPLPELENESPLAVMLAGEAGAVATLLQNARGGIPG